MNASLRNIDEGIEYSERAFINCRYSPATHISAGKNLAITCDNLGDSKKAQLYITKTIDFAHKAKVSREYISQLEILLKQFSLRK